jgi:hypothetical protein
MERCSRPVAKTPKKIRKLCAPLVAHMEKGYSFNSFSAECGVPNSTLREWADKHVIFGKAKELGEGKALHYWETVGILATQGGLQRLKSEVVKKTQIFDSDGLELDSGSGKQAVKETVIEREYERIPLREGMWKFVMASRFKSAGYVIDEDPGKLPDPEGQGPAQKVRTFQLSYAMGDQPYKVMSRGEDGEHGNADDRGPGDEGSAGSAARGADPNAGVGAASPGGSVGEESAPQRSVIGVQGEAPAGASPLPRGEAPERPGA